MVLVRRAARGVTKEPLRAGVIAVIAVAREVEITGTGDTKAILENVDEEDGICD